MRMRCSPLWVVLDVHHRKLYRMVCVVLPTPLLSCSYGVISSYSMCTVLVSGVVCSGDLCRLQLSSPLGRVACWRSRTAVHRSYRVVGQHGGHTRHPSDAQHGSYALYAISTKGYRASLLLCVACCCASPPPKVKTKTKTKA